MSRLLRRRSRLLLLILASRSIQMVRIFCLLIFRHIWLKLMTILIGLQRLIHLGLLHVQDGFGVRIDLIQHVLLVEEILLGVGVRILAILLDQFICLRELAAHRARIVLRGVDLHVMLL